MHKSVLDFDSAEHGHATNNQDLRRFRGIGLDVSALVLIGTENADTLQNYLPIFGNANLPASENSACLEHGLFTFNIGVNQINFVSPEYRHEARAAKVLGIYLPVAAAKDIERVKMRICGQDRGLAGQSLPKHGYTRDDDEHRPEVPEINVDEAHLSQLEHYAKRDKRCACRPASGVDDLDQANHDEDRGPEVEYEPVGQIAKFFQ